MRLRLIHAAYKTAWLALWLLSPLRHGRGRGVKAILTCEGRVLLVQHTYGPKRWELPGGGLHRREQPPDGIRREIREELSVDLTDAALFAVGPTPGRASKRRLSYFRAEIPEAQVVPDDKEIARVAWHRPDALPTPLGRHVARAIRASLQPASTRPIELETLDSPGPERATGAEPLTRPR